MKNLIFFLFLLLLFNTNIFSFEYEQNKLIVKISNEYYEQNQIEILKSGIKNFEQIIGKHKITHLVDKRILNNINQKNEQNHFLNKPNDIGIDRILLIEYSKNIDALFASQKLSSQNFIEYAEPLFIREIFDIETPNDSLFAEQYYLQSIMALEGWDKIDTINKYVVIGVVDTGVDYLHEDLFSNMYINQGETGLDSNGNDKRTNGIDDDNNGFIDDYMGWDFGSDSSENKNDNDPMSGNGHGTHVAGIIAAIKNNYKGIAGIGLNTKILPVKIAGDSPSSRSLVRSYDGLLYAAIAGANVINCSWGGGGFSQAEQDIINQALSLGAAIVAAAGNDYSNTQFFPASYKGVLSVAAIDSNNKKAAFSNYNASVDVSAPSVDIVSSIPGNNYVAWSGTSMASPIAAAVAGMVWFNFPQYIPIQIIEQVKATTQDISSDNLYYSGLLGTGKVSLPNAVSEKNAISININNYTIKEEIDDGIIKSGEKIYISFELFNTLNPCTNVKLYASSLTQYDTEFIKDELFVGDFETLELKKVNDEIELIVPKDVGLNYNLPVKIQIISDNGYRYETTLSILVNPTWRTMKQNNISLSFTSLGNLAYDDFPNNNRGNGFSYKNSPNILFEGALMVAYGSKQLSNVARGSSGSAANRDFRIIKAIENFIPGKIADEETNCEYSTRADSLSLLDTTLAQVKVIQTGYQFKEHNKSNFIIANYDIINNTELFQDSVFTALYMDWDIGPSGSDNRAVWNKSNEYAYIYNNKTDEYPYVGIKLLSSQNVNFWAIDNDGTSEDNPGVYDGFTKEEKYRMMSSGIGRDSSNSTDCSIVFGAGPIRLRSGDTSRVTFAIFAANSLIELDNIVKNELPTIKDIINPNGDFNSFTKKTQIKSIYPNPSSNKVTLEFTINDIKSGEISIWDINGKKLKNIFTYNSKKEGKIYPGYMYLDFDISELSQGQYFIKFDTDRGHSTAILNIIR